jgi:hypothetical protein
VVQIPVCSSIWTRGDDQEIMFMHDIISALVAA